MVTIKNYSFLFCFVLYGLAACNDHPLNPLDQAIVAGTIETRQQASMTKIDILWVVDNSGSMCQEQDNLTRNFEIFIDGMVTLNADFRLAVVTTDMKDPTQSGRFQNTPFRGLNDNCVDENNQPYVSNTADCPEELPSVIDSQHYMVDPNDFSLGLREPDIKRDFRCIATVGTLGYGFEQGLEAARTALSPYMLDSYNVGFLRDDAYLLIVFLSDENDCSNRVPLENIQSNSVCEWERDKMTPVEEFVAFFRSLKSEPALVLVAAIVAPDDHIFYDAPNHTQVSCINPETGDGGENGYRYIRLTEALGSNGVFEQICEPEYDIILERIVDLLIGLVNRICLAEIIPTCETDAQCPGYLCVDHGDQMVCSNWAVQVKQRDMGRDEFQTLVEDTDFIVNFHDETCMDTRTSISFLPGHTPNPGAEIILEYQKAIGE